MADPLSITASLVGIVGPALHGVRLLSEDLKQIKDAPDNVAALRGSIGSVERSLVSLNMIGGKAWESLGVAEETKTTIKICGETCDDFRTALQRWTKHSKGDSLSLLDRSKIGFWKQHHIESMEKKLLNCQVTITEVVSIATLISTLQNSHLMEETRERKEQEVKLAIQRGDAEDTDITQRKRDFKARPDDLNDDELEEAYHDAYHQLREQKKALDMSQALLKELLAKIQEPAISQMAEKMKEHPVNVTFGNNNSNWGLQLGVSYGDINNATFGGPNQYGEKRDRQFT
ncbi:hypothetical protein N7451_011520 [Penicillium sp. IBT 35674x]|nr:hypothetical protein N7451_011520 [Penicillium sp. IBT 35674x]